MFGHLPELFIVLIIALIVFGPEKLPEVAATAGKMVREVRAAVDEAMNPIHEAVPDDFSTYYYESLARTDEGMPTFDEGEVLVADTHETEGDEHIEPLGTAQRVTEAHDATVPNGHPLPTTEQSGAHPVERQQDL